MLDFVHIISPTMVMELKGAFTRLYLYTSAPNQGTNASAKFGMPNTDVNDQISGLATMRIQRLHWDRAAASLSAMTATFRSSTSITCFRSRVR